MSRSKTPKPTKQSVTARRTLLRNNDVFTLVGRARALALDLLLDGLTDADGTLYERLEKHVGIPTPIGVTDDDEYLKVIAVGKGAFAIGIAVGLLLHPDVFKTGGAR